MQEGVLYWWTRDAEDVFPQKHPRGKRRNMPAIADGLLCQDFTTVISFSGVFPKTGGGGHLQSPHKEFRGGFFDVFSQCRAAGGRQAAGQWGVAVSKPGNPIDPRRVCGRGERTVPQGGTSVPPWGTHVPYCTYLARPALHHHLKLHPPPSFGQKGQYR